MGKKIRAIVKRADEAVGHMTNISDSLEALQKLVGGYIETVTFADYDRDIQICVICDEEGRLKDKPWNCFVEFGEMRCGFAGDIAVVGLGEEDFEDLPAEITMNEWKGMIS